MTIEEQIVDLRKKGYGYAEIRQVTGKSNETIAGVLRSEGLISDGKRNRVGPVTNSSKMFQAVTYDDVRALKARVKVGTRFKIRTEKCAAAIDDVKGSRDQSLFRIGTVTSVSYKRFLTLKYDSGIVESFQWSELVAMLRQERCKVVRW